METAQFSTGHSHLGIYRLLSLEAGPRCIRLLDLSSPASRGDEDLSGTLRVANLQDCPEFTALSYVWGARPTRGGPEIKCNGFPIPITPSCHEALLALRGLHGAITIWVDAICINQRDEKEKAAQITLMEEIYTWAEVVYVWLGRGSERTDKTMDGLMAISGQYIFPSSMPWRSRHTSPATMKQERLRFARVVAFSPLHTVISLFWGLVVLIFQAIMLDFSGFHALLDRPGLAVNRVSVDELLGRGWIQRAWTFQEVILASNPVLVAGNKELTWAQLQQAVYGVHRRSSSSPSSAAKDALPSSEVFREWESLLKVWTALPRPCSWNGRRFRSALIYGNRESVVYSVDDFVRLLNPLQVFAYTGWVVAVIDIVVVGASISVVAFAAGSEEDTSFEEKTPTNAVVMILYWSINVGAIFLACAFGLNLQYVSTMARYEHGYVPEGEGRATRKQQDRVPVLGLIRALRERQATDPKDQAFAFYGVLRRLGCQVTTADYAKSIGQIYQELIRNLIAWEPAAVNLLIDAGSTMCDVQSWVPDWQAHYKRWLPSTFNYHFLQINEWSAEELGMAACGTNATLVAATVATVAGLSNNLPSIKLGSNYQLVTSPNRLLQATESLLEWLYNVRRDVHIPETYESLPQAVFDVLNGALSWRQATIGNCQVSFSTWYSLMIEYCSRWTGKEAMSTADSQEILSELIAHGRKAAEFTIYCCHHLSGRRGLFYSTNGYMGSGPESVIKGDQICIFRGVAVPMVIRAGEDGKYRLLGPAFVPGLMDLRRGRLERMELDWQRVKLA